MKPEEIQGEITGLKSLLTDTDYTVLKTLEGILSCTSTTAVTNYLKELPDTLRETVAKRVAWRARINELEAMLDQPGEVDG